MHSTYAAIGADNEADKKVGRVVQAKVQRHRAGKAPEWLDARNDADQVVSSAASREVGSIAAPVIVKKADDPRLARLAMTGRREIRAAEVVVQHGRRRHEEEEEDQRPASHVQNDTSKHAPVKDPAEEEDIRRNAVREKLLMQQREAEARLADAEDSESEYETDSEDDNQLLKPVFVPKQARDTIAEREALQREDNEKEEREKKRLEERKLETQKLVRETVALEDLTNKLAAGPIMQANEIDTDDEKDDERVAYDEWKERELGRMTRDKEENDKAEAEALERERLKNMTEEEREAWEAEQQRDKAGSAVEKPKMRFLQKYWHKGAYFQEEGDDAKATAGGYDIYQRDYSAPTGEDKFDKEAMPAVMQVKSGKWGKIGQTKWKHLSAEDTTFIDRQKTKEGGPGKDDVFANMPIARPPKRSLPPPAASKGSKEEFKKPTKFKSGY